VLEDCPDELAELRATLFTGRGSRIDPIVSPTAPPAAPTVTHASPVPEYPRHQGGSVLHLARGYSAAHPCHKEGATAGLRSLRERLVPHVRVSPAQRLPRLALIDLSTAVSLCAQLRLSLLWFPENRGGK
jgi:hypothetical protein